MANNYFPHDIRQKNWKTNDGTKFLAEKNFRVAFSKPAYRWFDKTVLGLYPDAKRIQNAIWSDAHHFEIGDLIIELH